MSDATGPEEALSFTPPMPRVVQGDRVSGESRLPDYVTVDKTRDVGPSFSRSARLPNERRFRDIILAQFYDARHELLQKKRLDRLTPLEESRLDDLNREIDARELAGEPSRDSDGVWKQLNELAARVIETEAMFERAKND